MSRRGLASALGDNQHGTPAALEDVGRDGGVKQPEQDTLVVRPDDDDVDGVLVSGGADLGRGITCDLEQLRFWDTGKASVFGQSGAGLGLALLHGRKGRKDVEWHHRRERSRVRPHDRDDGDYVSGR